MAITIGLFEREQQVLDAAGQLRAAGIGAGSLRAIVKNVSSAPLLAAQSGLPVEGLAGLREEAERRERDEGDGLGEGWFLPSAAVLFTQQGSGTPGPLAPFAALGFAGVDDSFAGAGDRLEPAALARSFGLPAAAAPGCASALAAGRFLLVVEAAPDSGVPALLRAAGALDVLA